MITPTPMEWNTIQDQLLDDWQEAILSCAG